jgi:hypothetical protein
MSSKTLNERKLLNKKKAARESSDAGEKEASMKLLIDYGSARLFALRV